MDTLLLVNTKTVLFHCIQSYSKGLLTKKYDEAFVVSGFCNWKKALERLQRHVISQCHKESVYRLKAKQAPTIREQVDICVSKTLALQKEMLLKQLSSICYNKA